MHVGFIDIGCILAGNNKVSAEEGIRMNLPNALGMACGLRALSAFLLRAGTAP